MESSIHKIPRRGSNELKMDIDPTEHVLHRSDGNNDETVTNDNIFDPSERSPHSH